MKESFFRFTGIERINARYRFFFIDNHYSVFFAAVYTFFYFVLLAFFKLERLQGSNNFYQLFPQLKPNRFKAGDPIRFVNQLCFLLLVKFKIKRKSKTKKKSKKSIFSLLPWALSTLSKIDQKTSQSIRSFLNKESSENSTTGLQKLAKADFWEKPHISNLILVLVLFLLATFITVPFSLEAQAKIGRAHV